MLLVYPMTCLVEKLFDIVVIFHWFNVSFSYIFVDLTVSYILQAR